MNDDTQNDDEFAGIPNMPSDESLRKELLRTGSVEHWNVRNAANFTPTDFSQLPKETAERVLAARLATGPGAHANAWQQAVWGQWRREAELDKEEQRILQQLEEVRGYDPTTGKGIPAITSPEKRKALGNRLYEIADDKARIAGEPGQQELTKALNNAVYADKVRHRNAYIQAEAKRRAAQSETEALIDKLAVNYRKGAATVKAERR